MKFRLNPLILATAAVAAASSAHAVDGIWINNTAPIGDNSGLWATGANWSSNPDELSAGPGTPAGGAGGFADFSQVELTADNVVGIGAATTIGRLKFGDITPSHNWIIALGVGAGTSRALTLDNDGSAAVIEVLSGTTVTVNGAAQTGAATGLTLNVGANGFNKTGAGTLQIAAAKSIFAGSGLVTVAGGTLSLNQSAANTVFTGTYQVNEGGTLAFSNGSLGANSGTITMNGGTLKWNEGNTENIVSRLVMQADKTSTLDTGGNHVIFNTLFNSSAGNVVKAGSGSLSITGNHQGSGLLRVAEGTLILGNTNGNANFQGTYQVDTGAILSVGSGGGAGNLYNGTIDAPRSVVLNGGTLLYNRPTSGGLTVLNAAVTGNGTVSVIGGTNGFGQVTGGTIGGSADFILQSDTATFSLDNTYTGTTTITAGTLRVGAGGTSGSLGSGDVINNASLIFDRSNDFSVANDISGTGGLTKLGAGTQTLSGTSTYTGATTVSAGTLLVTGALGDTAVSVGADGTIGGTGTLGGSLHFTSGATLHIADIDDALSITGNVTFAGFGFGNITGWDYMNADEGTYTLLAGSNFNLTNVSNVDAEDPFNFGNGKQGYFKNGSLQVVIIPEPSTAALLGGMGLFVLLRRRRA